jgi:hypothetical protein
MEEETQFRFTDEIKKKFEELAIKEENENTKIQIGIVINFLTAVEQQLQLVEGSDAKDFIDTSALYDNLILGRDDLIGLTGNKPQNTTQNTPPEQSGGMRASPNSEFMKNYIKEYIKTDELMITPLTKFTDLVENMYTTRTINNDKYEELQVLFNLALDTVSSILRIINQGLENNEQKFLIETDNRQPRTVYLIIMQTFLDMITLVLRKVNYLNDQEKENRIKGELLALYNDWKNIMLQNRNTQQNAFQREGIYFSIQEAVTG